MIDPKSQTQIRNTYELGGDPGYEYQRVAEQEHGAGHFQYHYDEVTPDPQTNNGASQVTIVNDRVGNVRELYYDAVGALVSYREYTGRADPALPTTLSTNRPTGKLRSSDPDWFEKRYVFDSDYSLTSEVFPNGDAFSYVRSSSNDPRASGNLLSRTRTPAVTTPSTLPASLTESWTYHPVFNSLTSYTPPKGAAFKTEYIYDSEGNRTEIRHPVVNIGLVGAGGPQVAIETFAYDASGRMIEHVWPGGRRDTYSYGSGVVSVLTETVDADGFQLVTTYERDARDNVTAIEDPRGARTEYLHNALDQVVRKYFPVAGTPQLASTEDYVDTWYDANDNAVRSSVRALDALGQPEANEFLWTEYQYDVLDNVILERSEIAETGGVIEWAETVYAYDANENRIREEYGEFSAQPGNSLVNHYDERDLLFQTVRGEGTLDESTNQFDYDANRNVVRMAQGLEGTPRETVFEIDGYDRIAAAVNGEGNRVSYEYDAHGNVIDEEMVGELLEGSAGSTAGNASLMRLSSIFDERDRRVSTDREWFDPATQLAIDDGLSSSTRAYNEDSQLVFASDDNGHITEWSYDTAQRIHQITDPSLSTTVFGYDASSNTIHTTDTEYPDGGGAAVVSTTSASFDLRGRQLTATDEAGGTRSWLYDSRDQAVAMTDERGNVTHSQFDGLGRIVTQGEEIRVGGTGAGGVQGLRLLTWEWDRSSRLKARSDGEGNRTEYFYDSLGRRVRTEFADGTEFTVDFDVHGNPIERTDANGSVVTATFDLMNRELTRTITRAQGVEGTTSETFAYDGLSRIVSADDDDTTVDRSFDSLGNLRQEEITVGTSPAMLTQFGYDGVGNLTSIVYPGGRTIHTTYDELDHPSTVTEGATTLASYGWAGRGRIGSIDRVNGTSTTYGYDTGRRIGAVEHSRPGTTLADWTYQWDLARNKIERKDLLAGFTYTHGYDSLGRMLSSTSDNPALGDTSYELDLANNREKRTVGTTVQNYVLDATLPNPGDKQVNQYTSVPSRTLPQDFVHDENGNLTERRDSGVVKRDLTYDYRNQMVAFEKPNGVRHEYAYDAFKRRVARIRNAHSVNPSVTHYAYAMSEVIEERNEQGVVQATYVRGPRLDEPVSMQRAGSDSYYHADDQGSVLLLTNASGQEIERYAYADYGRPLDGTTYGAFTGSNVNNPYFFTGRRRDSETTWYYYRTRYYVPKWGRFTTRDSIGIWGDTANAGNGSTYANNNPWSAIDPFGMSAIFGDGLMSVLVGDDDHGFISEAVTDLMIWWAEPPPQVEGILRGTTEWAVDRAVEQAKEDLSTLGMFPWIGDGADGLAVIVSVIDGDGVEGVVIYGAGFLPFVAMIEKGPKAVRRIHNLASGASDAAKKRTGKAAGSARSGAAQGSSGTRGGTGRATGAAETSQRAVPPAAGPPKPAGGPPKGQSPGGANGPTSAGGGSSAASSSGRRIKQSTSRPRTVDQALDLGQRFVGDDPVEIADGIWRSADGTRQFRITNSDILGHPGKMGPHAHFESINPATGAVTKNIHVPLLDP